MRNGHVGETRICQHSDEGKEAGVGGFGRLRGEEKLVQSVDLAAHFGGDEDAGDDGDGAEAEMGRRAFEEKPCEGRIVGVVEESFGECGCFVHDACKGYCWFSYLEKRYEGFPLSFFIFLSFLRCRLALWREI